MTRILIAGILLFMTACAYDNAEELYGEQECPPGGVSFSQVVSPIIGTNCAISGCHVSGQQQPALETYDQISANASRVKARTSNGTMPPPITGITLTQIEIDQISCWVDAGAPDN